MNEALIAVLEDIVGYTEDVEAELEHLGHGNSFPIDDVVIAANELRRITDEALVELKA